MESIITAFVVLIFIGNSNGYSHRHNESIFIFRDIRRYCDMKCGEQEHTLCQDEEIVGPPPPKCSTNFFLFKFDQSELMNDVMMGLNGLRSRIAKRMRVADMILLSWDNELSLMSQRYLSMCNPWAPNPCTSLGKPVENVQEDEPRYYHVAENFQYRESRFFPYHFVPSVLRKWYYEKNNMEPPTIHKSKFNELYGLLNVHNNFTRLANPTVSRVGCAIARYKFGYALHCNFFPYFQTPVRFSRGPPTTNCPNQYPLKGVIFPDLCTSRGVRFKGSFNILFICWLILTGTGCSGSACKGV